MTDTYEFLKAQKDAILAKKARVDGDPVSSIHVVRDSCRAFEKDTK